MSNSANLPAPFLGVDQKIAKAGLKSPFCENLLNFNTDEIGISLRNGDSKYAYFASLLGAGEQPVGFAQYGDTSLFFCVYSGGVGTKIYNTSGTLVYTGAGAGAVNINTLFFNKNLFIFTRQVASTSVVYNGSAWGAVGYTGTGFNVAGGNVYKNRAYLIQYLECAYWYSGIDAISGACTKVDLSGVVSENCYLAGIQAVTLADTISAVTLQAFIMSNGEILFYDGSYPDSTSWQLVGKSKIGSPLNFNSIVQYQGDGLVLCDTGVVSLRDLFLKGSEDGASLTVNSRIQPSWTQLVQAIRTSASVPVGPMDDANRPRIAGVWDQKTNRIIISFAYTINSSGSLAAGNSYFVFNTQTQSWYFHLSTGGDGFGGLTVDIARFQNKILTLGYTNGLKLMIWEKEGATGFTDRKADDSGEATYNYEMLSAPIPFPKTAVYEATQIEPILESDLYAQTNYNFVVDFGRQTSGNQPTDAATTSVAKPAVNVGMQNITYVQVKMSGTTAASKTVGLDLYSFNVWYSAGEIGSR